MKRMSLLAAIVALLLVGTSAFKTAHENTDTHYGLELNDNGDLILIDVTGLTKGETGDYNCVEDGDCIIVLTSGTPIQDPIDERKYTVEDGTYDVIEEGTFVDQRQ